MNLNQDLNLITDKVTFTNPLYLSSGRILEPFQIIYETYGFLNENKSNAILILHALTGSHHAAGLYDNDKKAGWWDKMIGKNKAIDTEKYYVICASTIGTPYGSTSPISPIYRSFGNDDHYRLNFPVITIQDMSRSIYFLINHLKITKLHAVIGGSMGGMKALSLCVLYPKLSHMYIPISTSFETNPMVILINKVMSECIMNDSEFKNGNYKIENEDEFKFKGLQIARMIGFSQYISLHTMKSKFGRKYVNTDGFYEISGRFEIERYLEYNSFNFCNYFDPLCYLYLIKALSLYDLSLGFNTLHDALNNIKSKIHLLAFSGDNMFPVSETKFLREILVSLNKEVSLNIVDSDYGHDSFLVEFDKFSDYIHYLINEE